jgi:hypothetical protein
LLLPLLLLRTSALQDFVQFRLIQQLRVSGLDVLLQTHMATGQQAVDMLLFVQGDVCMCAEVAGLAPDIYSTSTATAPQQGGAVHADSPA